MKRLLILAALAAALLSGSCDDWFECDVTIKNDTGRDISVALSQLSLLPDSFTTLKDKDEALFSVTSGKYYAYIYTGSAPVHSENSVDLAPNNNGTWAITYNSSTGRYRIERYVNEDIVAEI